MIRFRLDAWVAVVCACCSAELSAQGTQPPGAPRRTHAVETTVDHSDSARKAQRDGAHVVQLQQHAGPPLHPNVVDSSFEGAVTLLQRTVDVRVFRRDSDTFDGSDGHVARQIPPANTPRQPGERVDTVIVRHVIQRAPQRVPVPKVIGRSLTNAIAVLNQASLVASSSVPTPTDSAHAIVTDQQPKPSDSAVIGSSILLVFAQSRKVLVPSVIGADTLLAYERLAASALRGSILKERRGSAISRGNVAGQDPSEKVSVDSGTTVRLWLSAGPAVVPVPPLVGRTQDEARDTLTSLGLVLAELGSERKAAKGARIRTQIPGSAELTLRGAKVYVTYQLEQPGIRVSPYFWAATVLIILALITLRSGVLRPTFRTNFKVDGLSLEFAENSPVVKHDFTLTANIDSLSADFLALSGDLVLKDVRSL